MFIEKPTSQNLRSVGAQLRHCAPTERGARRLLAAINIVLLRSIGQRNSAHTTESQNTRFQNSAQPTHCHSTGQRHLPRTTHCQSTGQRNSLPSTACRGMGQQNSLLATYTGLLAMSYFRVRILPEFRRSGDCQFFMPQGIDRFATPWTRDSPVGAGNLPIGVNLRTAPDCPILFETFFMSFSLSFYQAKQLRMGDQILDRRLCLASL